MKIGIQTWGSRGDIVPWIALGQGLQKAGHEVIVYYTDGLSGDDSFNYSGDGLTVRSTKDFRKNNLTSKNIPSKRIFDMDPDELTAYMMDEVFTLYEEEVIATAEYLCEGSDFIISGPILYQTTAIAEKHHIPLIIILVDYLFTPKNNNELFEADLNRVFAERINRFRQNHTLPLVNNVRSEVFNSSVLNLLVFSNLFKSEQISLPQEFRISGFLKIENDNTYDLPDDLKQFLNNGDSPVFFSMGSLSFFEGDDFEILNIFMEAIRLSGCRAIIQARWDKISQPVTPHPDIYTIGYIPHELIFPHCLAAVHHGGAGTTHTTLLAGCPSIVIAYAWDQFYWGRELVRLGTAPGLLKRKYVDPQQLAGDIRKIMTDPEYKMKAEEARKKIKRENGVRKAVSLIEEYMTAKGKLTNKFQEVTSS